MILRIVRRLTNGFFFFLLFAKPQKSASCAYFHNNNDVDYITRTNGDIPLHGMAISKKIRQREGKEE